MGGEVEAAGLSGACRGGRVVRTSAQAAGTPGCLGKSVGRAARLLGSVWPQCGLNLNGGESRVEESKRDKYVKRSAERAWFGSFAVAISRQIYDGRGTERY